MKKSLAAIYVVGTILLAGCGSPEQTPPQQVPAGESRDAFIDSVLDETTTFKKESSVIIVGIAKGACEKLKSGMSKDEALKKITESATSDEESKDYAVAFDKGVVQYCPEFS